MSADSTVIPELFPVPDCEGYSVSRDGRVWSYHKTGPYIQRRVIPVVIKPEARYSKDGRLKAMMVRVNNRKWRMVHYLMLVTFVGPQPEGMEGCHWDHNPANNHIDNLRWDTKSSNILDRTRRMREEQRSYVGHKLTREQVLEIKRFLLLGHSCASLGRTYGVTTENIWSIKSGKTWKWIDAHESTISGDSPRITD